MQGDTMSDFWWHNIPQHSVGDLVKNKTRYLERKLDGTIVRQDTFIVVATVPTVPCRVHPVQRIRCVRCCDGFETRYSEAKGWSAVGK
jgi:hypothetical protein